jgi:hypothetical protein
MTRSLGALVALSTLASGVWAQQPTARFASSTGDPRLEARLDARTRAAVGALLDSARQAGLPLEPLVQRALEGSAKKAEGRVIVGAVRNVIADLSTAKNALGPAAAPAEISAGAAAIRNGVSVRELEKVRSARAGVRLASAFGVLSDLVAQGVPADTASSVIASLVRLGVGDDQLVALKNEIALAVATGSPAGAATILHGQGLEQQLAANLPPNSGGASGSALPSSRGSTRGPGATPPSVGTAVGNRIPGDGSADVPPRPVPAPRGRSKRRP